jgi:hypothetical protein
MKRAFIFFAATATCFCPIVATAETHPGHGYIYLDKMDQGLDQWWNALDGVCRSSPDNEQSDLACDQRLEVDKLIEKRGCWNIYPATGPHDTSYWLCNPND